MDTVLEKKWEVYALKYAERTDRTRKESFIFDDHSHEAHTIDYFIWVLKSDKNIIIVDTGYDYDEAKRRNLYLPPRAIASLTVGDGAAAYILGPSKEEGRIRFSKPFTLAQYNRHCIGQACKNHRGPQMRTKARDLQNGVLNNLGIFLQRAVKKMDLKWEEIDHTYSHPTTPKAVKKGAKLATEIFGEINFLHNDSAETANTASTTHGVLLEISQNRDYLNSNETVFMVSFGSGLAIIANNRHLYEPKQQRQTKTLDFGFKKYNNQGNISKIIK